MTPPPEYDVSRREAFAHPEGPPRVETRTRQEPELDVAEVADLAQQLLVVATVRTRPPDRPRQLAADVDQRVSFSELPAVHAAAAAGFLHDKVVVPDVD